MSTSHEIKLDPMGFSVLNMQLLDIVVAGGHILSPEKAVASARLARPLLEKVRAARKDGRSFLVEEEELDNFIFEQLNRIAGLGGADNPEAKDLYSTLFTIHSAWEVAGGLPRPAFLEFQNKVK